MAISEQSTGPELHHATGNGQPPYESRAMPKDPWSDGDAAPVVPHCSVRAPDLTLQGRSLGLVLTLQAVTRVVSSARHDGRSWASVLFDQLLVSGTSFVMTVVVGRYLGKTQLGLYVLGYSVVIVLLEVQNSFITSPYTLNSARLDRDAHAKCTGNALALTIGLSALAAVVLLAAGTIVPSGFGAPELRPLFPILSLIAAPLLVKEFARRACFATFQTREVLLLDILVSLIQMGGLLLLVGLGSPSVRSVYRLIATASGAAAIVWMTMWRHRTVLTLSGALHTLRDTWSFGMWVLTGNLAFVLSQQLYPWYLASLKGPEATGAFAACAGLLALVNPLVSAIGNYLGPVTANAALRGGRDLSRVLLQASILLSGAVGLFCLVTIMLGNQLLLLLYGSGYKVDAHVFLVLAASVFASTSTMALGFGFWALGRPDMNLKINFVSTVIATVLGPWLVGTHGLLGAAYGLLVANATVSVLRVLLLRRILHRA